MSRLRVAAFSVSLDGFGAGPNQSLENPLGEGGPSLHTWVFGTETFKRMHTDSGVAPAATEPNRADVDEDFAVRGFENLGAWILGRNMFGPQRGPWADEEWKGWWGANPPYHVPVFVLTHHARAPLTMEGGTTFHFVTDGIHAALARAKEAAKGKEIRLGGGVATIRAYLQAGLVDELHLAIAPVLLGRGENLLHGIDMAALGYRVTSHRHSANATHVVLAK